MGVLLIEIPQNYHLNHLNPVYLKVSFSKLDEHFILGLYCNGEDRHSLG